ncbi:MAG: NERD domain-containing protein [Lachnospiraceae bacterium]|nr:NERD domain-containing protein [Lachnospiraceae bacterium]
MGLFTKKIGTVILKEESDSEKALEKLKELSNLAKGDVKDKIEDEIKRINIGNLGEQNILYALKTSGIDMYVLRDFYTSVGELSVQIDFVVITRKMIYHIECKNLYGNIEIDSKGNFYRVYNRGKKEGMDSPITQAKRHMEILKMQIQKSNRHYLVKILKNAFYERFHKPIIVLANPKTVVNDRYAKKEIKDQVIRCDQLAEYIKKYDAGIKEYPSSAKEMLELAQSYLDVAQENPNVFLEKYKLMVLEQLEEAAALQNDSTDKIEKTEKNAGGEENSPNCVSGKVPEADYELLRNKLKKFRLEYSKAEQIQPYFIFNNLQMEDLIAKSPRTKEELFKVNGFGEKKVEKYGDIIVGIINDFYQL